MIGENPEGPVDHDVGVIRIDDLSGKPIATVMTAAAHTIVLCPRTSQLSPDYVGPAREIVERATGALSLFFQGAAGNVSPRCGIGSGGPAQFDDLHRIGAMLGGRLSGKLDAQKWPFRLLLIAGPLLLLAPFTTSWLGTCISGAVSSRRRHTPRTGAWIVYATSSGEDAMALIERLGMNRKNENLPVPEVTPLHVVDPAGGDEEQDLSRSENYQELKSRVHNRLFDLLAWRRMRRGSLWPPGRTCLRHGRRW